MKRCDTLIYANREESMFRSLLRRRVSSSVNRKMKQATTGEQAMSKGSTHPVMNEGSVLNPEVKDYVDSPAHYTGGEIECINAIEAMLESCDDGYEGYLRGQIIKYTWRFRQKSTLSKMEVAEGQEDLQKAQWYQHRLMDYNIKRHARDAKQKGAALEKKLLNRIG